jgi:hypothetical protein
MEDLRQICIHRSDNSVWWYYASMFGDQCLNLSNPESCSETIMKTLRINVDFVKSCMKESFEGNPRYAENQVLKNERNNFVKRGIQSWPTLVINQVIYRVNF